MQVRELSDDLQWALWIHRCTMPKDEMLARLAVAFLICPERLLVCANREKQQEAAFLGEVLVDFPENGNHVVVLFGQTYKGLKCCLHLPCTDWVLANSGLQEPQLSFQPKLLAIRL